jgi:hypothetical protein
VHILYLGKRSADAAVIAENVKGVPVINHKGGLFCEAMDQWL